MKELLKAVMEERNLIYQMYLVGDDRDDENIQDQTDFEDFNELDLATSKAIDKRIKLEKEYEESKGVRDLMERYYETMEEWNKNVMSSEQIEVLLEDEGYTEEEIRIVMS